MRLFGFLILFITQAAFAIIGGEVVTDITENNYIVALEKYKISNNERVFAGHCTGAYISPHVILTAAHCLAPNLQEYQIKAINDTARNRVQNWRVTSTVIEQIPHPEYQGNSFFDIALLKLRDRALYAVKPLVLPPADFFIPERTPVLAIGFGLNSFVNGVGKNDNLLHKVFLESLGLHRIAPALQVRFDKNHGFCFGDSGSPAVYHHEGQNYVLGVASTLAYHELSEEQKQEMKARNLTFNQYVNEHPEIKSCEIQGFYSNVLVHLDWIKSKVEELEAFP